MLRRVSPTGLVSVGKHNVGDVLKAMKVASDADTKMYEALVIDMIGRRVIDELRKDPSVVSKLKRL